MASRRRSDSDSQSMKLPPPPTAPLSHSPPPTAAATAAEFEFRISRSPHKSSPAALRPADELFYKGKLLPLHLSPRLSMLRHLLLSSATSVSFSDSARDSTESNSSSSSSSSSFSAVAGRLSSATDDGGTRLPPPCRLHGNNSSTAVGGGGGGGGSRYFSLSRVSSVVRKCIRKVKKLSQRQSNSRFDDRQKQQYQYQQQQQQARRRESFVNGGPHSFNLYRYQQQQKERRSVHVSSCPSSIRSSPSRQCGSSSSMEELQSAIQGAIAYCKSSMIQTRSTTTKEI